MLELRPNCECCDRDLAPDAAAFICSFECTFCESCSRERFGGVCPNCGGELVRRPIRPSAALARFPASAKRVRRDHDQCAAAVGPLA
ncbi:MAG TPA: DUF1272 domain-containing protein [Phenylobacterium sp.]|jgi:hypothetical protein|uniref:DUF1272 domain-containing protein n=1 Tax=Phenylobacterium sp. TaxID=1871053 RepID=UPI002D6F5EA1|nr:DUF1272 domain-containing protein [Phenylobacterium sp.]HZZ67333.1 DUF1272 domain-containing protein [Phenylobacterium sp.]